MTKRIGGFRRKSRHKLRKHFRSRGKLSLTRYFQTFAVDDKIQLQADSGVHEGMYFPRFHGRHGIITGKKGRCYHVHIQDGGKAKNLIVHPVHLKKV